jgi:uncharacterized protein (TIGR02466 family)
MVDVTQHKVFPTIINEFQFSMDKQEHDLVIDELNDMEKYKENNLITQTTDDLSKHIPKFTKKIYNITEHICEKYSYLYDRLEFTGMWANKLIKGEVHPPHTHSNNIFSGVYYLEGGSQIQFFDPRPQASVFQTNVTKVTQSNASMLAFDSQKGAGLIFPSWLTHWVPVTDKTRISISWNILLRGDYGQPNTLQNSHI